LKNSFTENWLKKLINRMPYKRRSRLSRTFCIPQIFAVLTKMEFFNSHACLQQLLCCVGTQDCRIRWRELKNAMNKAKFLSDFDALFDSNGKVKNYRKAFPLLVVAAENGHPHAQNLVGYCYNSGHGGARRNARTAVRWYKKAVKNGYDEAIYNLALCYAHGKGTPKNERKAFHLNQRAAMMGHVWASCNLGVMYAKGVGSKSNPVLAVRWWREAAQKGDTRAQYNLGSSYVDGFGARRNRRLGAIWLGKAASHGHKTAARELRSLQFNCSSH
jgi:hypothetical protein